MSKIEKELKNLPPYISLNDCGMRLVVTELPYEPNIIEYYRDAGDWSIEIDVRTDGKIYSIINWIEELNGIELIPITYDIWKEDNENYVDNNIRGYGDKTN
jgi:hypothetical protein